MGLTWLMLLSYGGGSQSRGLPTQGVQSLCKGAANLIIINLHVFFFNHSGKCKFL